MLTQLRRAFLRQGEHVDLGAELEAAGRARLDARGLQTLPDAVRTQRALVDFLGRGIEFRNIERASGYTVLTADAVFLVEVDDPVGVLDDRPLRGTGAEAARILAVHALVLAHRPHQRAVVARMLVELDQVPVVPRRRRHRLIRVVERRLAERHVVPFDTRDLAGFAADTRGRVDVLAHLLFAVHTRARHRTGVP